MSWTIQYNTTLLSLCREICLLARHLQKTFNTFNNKRSTTQWNTELKTAQIQGKYLTITMYTHAHTLFFWVTNNLKHSINYNKTKFLKRKKTKEIDFTLHFEQWFCEWWRAGSDVQHTAMCHSWSDAFHSLFQFGFNSFMNESGHR